MTLRLISFIAALMLLMSCNGPSGNPSKDARMFMNEAVEIASDKDYDKADMLIGRYLDFYSECDDNDKVIDFLDDLESEFESLDDKDQNAIKRFIDKPKFQRLSNVKKAERKVKKAVKKSKREKRRSRGYDDYDY